MSDAQETLPPGFVTPNFTGQAWVRTRLKKADDSVVLAILPLMGKMGDPEYNFRGEIGAYVAKHFGYSGVDPRNPAKLKFRPFLCIQEKDRQGHAAVECAECDLRSGIENKIAGIEAFGLSKNYTAEQIRQTQQPYKDRLRAHGRDGKWSLAAMNRSGQYTIFECPHGLYKKLQNEMKQCKDDDVAMGVSSPFRTYWFEFSRVGAASLTSDNVRPFKKKINVGGEIMEKSEPKVFTVEELVKAQKVLPDLIDEREKLRISPEKIQALTALSERSDYSHDPVEVDKILGPARKFDDDVGTPDVPAQGAPPAASGKTLEQEMAEFEAAQKGNPPAAQNQLAATVTTTPPTPAAQASPPAQQASTPAAGFDPTAADAEAEFNKAFPRR